MSSYDDNGNLRYLLLPVIAGLVVGSAFVVLFSSASFGKSSGPPKLFLTIDDDGKRYIADFNAYCPGDCEFLIYARVLSLPPIEINNDTAIRFETRGTSGPRSLDFIIQEYETIGNDLEFRQTNYQLDEIVDGRVYQMNGLPPGKYVLNVIADWNDNESFYKSIHRFRLVVN